MPHPIFAKPDHSLERVELRLYLPRQANGFMTTLMASGETSTKRGSLWSYTETWDHTEQRGLLEPTDALHYVALAAAQDRPNTQALFLSSITPGGWTDVQLPL